jgi:hypothetical protein
MVKFILTQSDLRTMIAINESTIEEGGFDADWFTSRAEFCKFLLKTYEFPE